jgi:Tol biopolymer transport system component
MYKKIALFFLYVALFWGCTPKDIHRPSDNNLYVPTVTQIVTVHPASPTVTQTATTHPASPTTPSMFDTLVETSLQVAYLSGRKIFIIDNGRTRVISLACFYCGNSITTSPDGLWLAYSGRSKIDPALEIYKIRTDGSYETQVFLNEEDKVDLSWDPTGKNIAFSNDGYSSDIMLLNIETATVLNITTSGSLESNPAWSPDGTQLAYVYRSNFSEDGELWVMNIDGTSRKIIADIPVAIDQVMWSPDGMDIVFSSPHNCGRIYVVNVGNSIVNPISNPNICASDPAWSPDGRFIIYVGKKFSPAGSAWVSYWDIVVVDIKTGASITVISRKDNKDVPQALIWLPEGTSK